MHTTDMPTTCTTYNTNTCSYFMDRVAQHLFVFEGDGVVRDFSGSFSDYLDHRRSTEKEHAASMKEKAANATASSSTATTASSTSSSSSNSSSSSSSSSSGSAKKVKMSSKQRKEYEGLEAAIEACGVKQAELQVTNNHHCCVCKYHTPSLSVQFVRVSALMNSSALYVALL
jgi:ATPase subunit of ABC transporter with duplicated ATPase domains